MERSGGRTSFARTVRLAFVVASFAFVFLDVGSSGTSVETTAAAGEGAAAAAAAAAAGPETLTLRSRRHAADQRMAEIQALLALGRMRGGGGGGDDQRMVYGHGMVDPHNVGRRSRLESKPDRNSLESQQDNDQGMDLNDNLFPEESK